ncbi:MAG: hypothetical protein QOE73_1969 [Verrucomicrobiota bacterium]
MFQAMKTEKLALNPLFDRGMPDIYFFPAALFLAAHLAFISCDSFLRPAAEIPFLREFLVWLVPGFDRFCFAQRARAAAAIFARVAADIRPLLELR